MPALKTLIPEMSEILGTTPAILYERQRILVEAGLLRTRSGRGRGSGVEATPDSLALLLISWLVTDRRQDAEARTRMMAKARPRNTDDECGLTGQKNFAAAVSFVLATPGDRFRGVEVSRSRPWAAILGQLARSPFRAKGSAVGGTDVTARLSGKAFRALQRLIAPSDSNHRR